MEKVRYIVKNPLSSQGKIVGLLVLVLVAGGVLASTLREGISPAQEQIPQQSTQPIADKALLYGNWAGDKSQIFAYDLNTQKEYEVASLPINVKKVTLLNENEVLFINNTDQRDHGKTISIFNITTGETTDIYTSDAEFGIDNYVISQDKTKLAVWEVRFIQEILRGGDSRVYTSDINTPNVKNLITTQIANSPVLYPLAITNQGEVFMDRFLPNDGAGWGYGMAVSDFQGSSVQDLENMTAGTYGTQPTLSKDGDALLFAGYDGSLGDGNTEVRGFRRALLSPNTVELLDTQTRQRSRLPLAPNNTYPSVEWEESGDVRITTLSDDPAQTGTFLYNINSQSLTKIQEDNLSNKALIANLNEDVQIFGQINTSSSFLGNLGENYASPYSDLTIQTNNETFQIPASVSSSQILSVVDSREINPSILTTTTNSASRDQLKLGSFEIKPTLEEKRVEQQTEEIPTPTPTTAEVEPPTPIPTRKPKCFAIALEQCNEQVGTNYSDSQSDQIRTRYIHQERCANGVEKFCKYNQKPLSQQEKAFMSCFWQVDHTQSIQGLCTASPLYLYGPNDLTVDVSIQTPVFNSNVPGDGNYNLKLEENNVFSSKDATYESLSFDYIPQRTLRPPIYGRVVRKENAGETIKEYATKLGLNKKETYDLVKDITEKAQDPYVFLSFYTQQQSKFMLPINFNPVPDTYINHVFYINNLTSPDKLGYTPKEPEFKKADRKGEFIAVEISVIGD